MKPREIIPYLFNIAAQGHPQDLQHVDMANYCGTNEHPPLHEHRPRAINNYAGVALDFPSQAQAAAPAPVRTDLSSPHTYLTRLLAGEDRRG